MPESTAATQQFVEIKEVKGGVVHLKSGGLRQILIVSGINFDLKSEDEQNLILHTFQNMLNALDFSIQLFVHSRKVNIEEYLENMALRKEKEPNELLKIQIEEYINFIRSFVEENAIINKTFFVIVPYDTSAIETQAQGIIKNILSTKSKQQESPEAAAQKNLEQLTHRVNQVIDGLEQIGLRVVPLNDEELTELFYNLYNPQLTEKKGIETVRNNESR